MNKTLNMTGGARIGMFNATWPLANLSATGNEIILNVLTKKYEIKKEKITSLNKYCGFISVGLKIEHSKNNIPNHIIFWTFIKQGIAVV